MKKKNTKLLDNIEKSTNDGQNKPSRYLKYIDLFFITSVLVTVFSAFADIYFAKEWKYDIPDKFGHYKNPVFLYVYLISIPFFVLGIVWLGWRFYTPLVERHPFLGSRRFAISIIIAAPIIIFLCLFVKALFDSLRG